MRDTAWRRVVARPPGFPESADPIGSRPIGLVSLDRLWHSISTLRWQFNSSLAQRSHIDIRRRSLGNARAMFELPAEVGSTTVGEEYVGDAPRTHSRRSVLGTCQTYHSMTFLDTHLALARVSSTQRGQHPRLSLQLRMSTKAAVSSTLR